MEKKDRNSLNCLIASIMREDGITGVQTHSNSLKNGLKELNIETIFLNSFSYYKKIYYPIYAIRPLFLQKNFKTCSVWWYRYWHFLFLYFSLKKYLRNKKINIINAQCPLSALASLRLRDRSKHKFYVILTCHFNISQAEEFRIKGEIKENSSIYRSIRSLEKYVLNRVDGVVYVSEFLKDKITAFHQVSNPFCTVINNGIKLNNTFEGKINDILDIKKSSFVITSVGTLEPRKNQRYLLEIMLKLLRKNDNYILLLIGDGQDRPYLEEYIKRNNMQRNVKILGFRKDVQKILSVSDLYCHPATMESFGIAIIEAFAQGLPVIANPSGGIPEIITHGKTGFLINSSDDKLTEYIKHIERLRNNHFLYKAISNNAKKYFYSNFTEKSMCQKYLTFYQQIIKNNLSNKRNIF